MSIDCSKPNLPMVKGNTIKLNTGNGEQTSYSYTPDRTNRKQPKFELAKLIAQGITKYSTDSDPNISETELNNFKQEIYEGFIGLNESELRSSAEWDCDTYGSSRVVVKDAVLNSFDRLYDVYANDKNITPEEYTKMLKTLLDSTGFGEKEKINQNEELPINSINAVNEPLIETENQPREKYWFGGLIDLVRAIIWTLKGD